VTSSGCQYTGDQWTGWTTCFVKTHMPLLEYSNVSSSHLVQCLQFRIHGKVMHESIN